MTPFLMVGIAVGGAVLVVLWWKGGSSVGRLVDAAVRAGEPGPIVTAASGLAHGKRSVLYQQAIAMLWEGWHRPLAIQVLKEFAKDHSHEKICQFWLKQAQEVEPLEVQKQLGPEFLKAHYRAEVAACCGRTSS
jgi:predicted alpha/beta-fold hydrolase